MKIPMIARLDTTDTSAVTALAPHYLRFLEALKMTDFAGEIAPDYANRTVLATDNSIYQRLPQAVVYPRHVEDLERIARLAAEPDRKSTRLNSSHVRISYAVFCLKKKNKSHTLHLQ